MTRICKYCGAAFEPQRTDQRYCSHRCRNIWNVRSYQAKRRGGRPYHPRRPPAQVGRAVPGEPRPITRTCPVCGATFTPVNGRQRFCSRACTLQAKYRRDGARRSEARLAARANRTCPVCGRTFTPKNARGKYCSMRCANLANRKPVAHDPKPCAWCGTAFTPTRSNQIFCSRECNLAAHGRSRKGTGISIRPADRADAARTVREEKVRAYLALPPAERYARRGTLTQAEHKLAQKLYLESHTMRTCSTNDLCH